MRDLHEFLLIFFSQRARAGTKKINEQKKKITKKVNTNRKRETKQNIKSKQNDENKDYCFFLTQMQNCVVY